VQEFEEWLRARHLPCEALIPFGSKMRLRESLPFQFVLDELLSIRPVVKQMFGFVYVYLDEKLLLALREQRKQPNTNGIWLFTYAEHLQSLRREFSLPRNYFWKSKDKGWVILPSRLENFEEYAFKACELILQGDRRIGRVTTGWSVHGRSKRLLY
jgi:hypothetical protein